MSSPATKRVQVGSLGVISCDMILDPDAEVTAIDQVNTSAPNYLYIAGGRHGLWAMEADPTTSTNLAILLDDSGRDQPPFEQGSRRWCNAVDVMTLDVDGTPTLFLVALFAKKDGNRVRIYPLDDVRQAMIDAAGSSSPTRETDYVMDLSAADVSSVRLPKNDNVPTPQITDPEVDFAYGFGMAVDDSDTARPHIYVALGMHGLVRIECEYIVSGQGLTTTKQFGPYFGDDSSYYQTDVGYGHMEMYLKDEPGLRHRERPLFMDVAVESLGGVTYVYAALDHLGWAKFVSNPWNASTTIRHHEGERMVYNQFTVQSGQQDLIGASIQGTSDPSYVHRINVSSIQNGLPIPGKDPIVLVTATSEPSRAWLGMANEGRALDYTGSDQGKIPRNVYPKYSTHTQDDIHHWTGIYRDTGGLWINGGLSTGVAGATLLLEEGGFYSHAPEVQPAGTTFKFFTGELVVPPIGAEPYEGKFSVARKEMTWNPASLSTEYSRTNSDRPGRWCWDVAPLLPEVGTAVSEENFLVTSGNDAGMAPTGTLYFDAAGQLQTLPDAETEGIDHFGIVFSPTAQWLVNVPNGPDERWILGAGRVGVTQLVLRRIELHDPTSSNPLKWDLIEEYYFRAPADPRFGREAYYGRGHVDPALDAALGGEYVVITLGSSQQSAYIFDRGELVTKARQVQGPGIGVVISDQQFLSTVPGKEINAVHREMQAFYDHAPPNAPYAGADTDLHDRLQADLRIGALGAAQPRFVELPGGRKILAFPAWATVLDPLQEDFALPAHAAWLPDQVWLDSFSRMFVRLYDLGAVAGGGVATDLPTYFGSDDQSSTIRVEFVQMTDPATSALRTFMLVADFQGSLVAHEVSDLDSYTPGSEPADEPRDRTGDMRWDLPESVSDHLVTNLYGLEIDQQGNRVVLYLSAWRLGVQMLEFDPFDQVRADGTYGSGGDGKHFYDWGLIQTSYHASSAVLQAAGPNNVKRLLVPDGGVGVRVYTE